MNCFKLIASDWVQVSSAHQDNQKLVCIIMLPCAMLFETHKKFNRIDQSEFATIYSKRSADGSRGLNHRLMPLLTGIEAASESFQDQVSCLKSFINAKTLQFYTWSKHADRRRNRNHITIKHIPLWPFDYT